jgi:alpha-mannosidase
MVDGSPERAEMTAVPPEVVHLVPHTHWDREWYLPFETFRLRLVGLIDRLLEEMEADSRVRFTLDGQTATVDDYLELRPDNGARVARLVEEGRLAVGPWAILMDEYLVSGETIVRDLELGMRRAGELGRVMRVGYLPDMFGHVAQMPQILAKAGIGDAVVWRGVPHAVDRHVFTWQAPDGSEVRCEYLYRGYGNARDVFDLPGRIEAKLDSYVAEMRPWFGADEILAMYGEDHSLPLPGYVEMIEAFNAGQDRYAVRVETLGEYLDATRGRSRPTLTWEGELRSSARANVLMGVSSHRIEVKQAAARAERWLERRAEPLVALHGSTWPERELALAWRGVIANSAHDSICACSAEETVQQVLARFASAEQIARGLVDATMWSIAGTVPDDGWVVWNPSPFDRTDVVELAMAADRPAVLVLADGAPIPVQELGVETRVVDDRPVPAADVVKYLRNRMHSRELYTYLVNGFSVEAGVGPSGRDVLTIDVSQVPDPPRLDIDALIDRLAAEAGAADAAAPGVEWQLRVVARPQRRLLAHVPVPALGMASLRPQVAPGDGPIARGTSTGPQGGVRPAGHGLTNGLLSVQPGEDGTLTIEGRAGRLERVGRIVDGGDVGDSYNYAPPPDDVVVEAPVEVRVELAERGPLRGVIRVERTYAWPRGLALDLSTRTPDTVATTVITTVELRVDEPFARLRVDFENASRDHRVRFHVPLPRRTDRSYAEGQYAIVARGLTMEGGHGERPLPTFPAHGLAAADGAVVLLDHLTEFELVDGEDLALTLLRATGLISRDRHPWRAEPAGPVIEAPSGQGIGRRSVRFALMPHPGAPDGDVLRALERYRGTFVVARGTGDGSALPTETRGLSIEGDGVVLTALRRRGSELELRVVNETAEPRDAVIRGPFERARSTDLLGSPVGELGVVGRSLRLSLTPWEIATLRLSGA